MFRRSVGYLSGQWIRHDQIAVGIDDVGIRQGVIAVERLRTYGGQIFAVDEHLARWDQSTSCLMISALPTAETLASLLHELLEKNEALVSEQGDVSITMFATPGSDAQPDAATLALHLGPLDHERIELHRLKGQPVLVTDVLQPAVQCWPRTIKVRSRIHYYLADAAARRYDSDAVGLLLDSADTITETSIANVAIVESGRILSPPPDRVLGGVTQKFIERIAAAAGIEWVKTPISVGQLKLADEVLLMGTNGGIWFANRINDRKIGHGHPGPIFKNLLERFDKLVREA